MKSSGFEKRRRRRKALSRNYTSFRGVDYDP
jgi:hypothetical protein